MADEFDRYLQFLLYFPTSDHRYQQSSQQLLDAQRLLEVELGRPDLLRVASATNLRWRATRRDRPRLPCMPRRPAQAGYLRPVALHPSQKAMPVCVPHRYEFARGRVFSRMHTAGLSGDSRAGNQLRRERRGEADDRPIKGAFVRSMMSSLEFEQS